MIRLDPCTNNVFSRTTGLPCAHRIASLLERNEAILLAEIHPFWKTGLCESSPAYLPLLEPLIPLPKPRKRKQDQLMEEDKEHIRNQTETETFYKTESTTEALYVEKLGIPEGHVIIVDFSCISV